MATLAVEIDSEIVGEMFLRAGPKADISSWIENVVQDYLERTADLGHWSEAYYLYRESQADTEKFQTEFGSPKGGYHWAPLFLPNGTLIRMEYKRQAFNAAVKFEKIMYEGKAYSPSELARIIAAGTNRNAWRDLVIKRPGDSDWCLADDLRRRMTK